jgi:hypothetical protein
LPLEPRLPTRPADQPTPVAAQRSGAEAEEIADMRARYTERFRACLDKHAARTERRIERSRAESEANSAQAADLRRRFR